MNRDIVKPILIFLPILALAALACSALSGVPSVPTETPAPTQPEPTATAQPTDTPFSGESNLPEIPTATSTPVIAHVVFPPDSVKAGGIVFDVESSGTAAENRAPYGDSYDIYRLERPFTAEMTYIPDMDIASYNVVLDEEWVFISIELIGTDPNNQMGIHYGVELDLNRDGFGDYIIWASPPYTPEWSTEGVQVFADFNHDTGGLSAELSDVPFDANGYEEMIFDAGIGDDPDLAWIRVNAGIQATVQFAFKRSFAGSSFMLGVLSDAGLKDVTKMFYNDRFSEEEAGSPEKSEKYYPLKALYAFDNACREPFGFTPNGFEPQLCPQDEPRQGPREQGVCQPPSSQTFACTWSYTLCCCTNFAGCQ
jgi:hypothetical protein